LAASRLKLKDQSEKQDYILLSINYRHAKSVSASYLKKDSEINLE
jgi:hypothetical protein